MADARVDAHAAVRRGEDEAEADDREDTRHLHRLSEGSLREVEDEEGHGERADHLCGSHASIYQNTRMHAHILIIYCPHLDVGVAVGACVLLEPTHREHAESRAEDGTDDRHAHLGIRTHA